MKQSLLDKLPKNIYLALKRWDYKRAFPLSFEQRQAMRTTVTENGYSYRGFDDKQAIFIHVPKCAGVSINQTLFGNLGGGHSTLEEYTNIFEPKCINSYFKFTFVRNPWDRVVSAYFFLEKGGFGHKDKNWFKDELSSYSSFSDFVKGWINKENIWKWHHFRPQHHYILDKRRKVSLDFIGYFENIHADFELISQRLGINSLLPASNSSNHKSYMDYYNDETQKIVGETYSEDIELLGYNFDNSSLPTQIIKRQLHIG